MGETARRPSAAGSFKIYSWRHRTDARLRRHDPAQTHEEESAMKNTQRLLDLVKGVSALCERRLDEPAMLDEAGGLLKALVAQDDWLEDAYAVPHPVYYQQHLLYGDPQDRFSVVSFVWGPGQKTPIHNHTVWGLIGMLRGSEISMPFERTAHGMRASGAATHLKPGDVERVSPRLGDIHQVSNALADQVSISIHLYGGNIGRIRRSVFDPATGAEKAFVSGYSNAATPNLWFAKAAP